MRFTTRDLLWAVVVAALICGWSFEHIRTEQMRGNYATLEANLKEMSNAYQSLRDKNSALITIITEMQRKSPPTAEEIEKRAQGQE